MSERKDSDKEKNTPSFELPDMDSTVRIDLSGNVISTSTDDGPSDDDFEKTLSGLTDIEELLNNENPLSESSEEVSTVSLSTDEINFDELDAGIDSLSDELSGSDSNADKDYERISDIPGLDDLAEFSAAESVPETVAETSPEEDVPIIELTEEMLDEPFNATAEETIDDNPEEDVTAAKNDHLSETPELTTTETHVLADATAAIKELHEEEKQHPQQEFAMSGPISPDPVIPDPITPGFPSSPPSSSTVLPVILALLGIAAGGFGAWMAFDASSSISDLQSQIRELQAAKASSADKQTLANLQQRLTKVERRLTGTPTVEAASPLGTTGPVAEDVSLKKKSETPKIKVITPKTPIASTKQAAETAPVTGDWVVNLSSHIKKSTAVLEKSRLQKLGLNAEVHTATIKGKTWYRVQVVGYSSKEAAKKALKDVQQRSGIKEAWIGKR